MFCPKCGQQQVADYTKFCSRCGLATSGLAEYVAGGAIVSVGKNAAKLAPNSPIGKATRRGAKVMFGSGVISPLFFGLCFLTDNPGPLLVPLSVFLAGLAWLLYAQLFGEETSLALSQPSQPSQPGAMPDAAVLPPTPNLRLHSAREPVGTAEIAPPPSVTEHTTKLLDDGEG